MNPQSAINAIKNRATFWRSGKRLADGRKLGLVIEGGGMRGVCSGGGAVALAHLGFTELFDDVYATSAGVMNASYFLSGQPELGITVYYDCLASRKFINPLRFWKILDIDYVFEHVVTVAKPLDTRRIINSRTNFFVVIMDKKNGAGRIVDIKKTMESLLDVLKAATAIPVLYNKTVKIDGHECMDGGCAIPFPIQQALDNGCTDILVLLTRPESYVCFTPSLTSRILFKTLCGGTNRSLCRTFDTHHHAENTARNIALGKSIPKPTANIATICTDSPEAINRMTANSFVLREAAIHYGRKVLQAFGVDSNGWSLLRFPRISGRGRKRFCWFSLS